MYKYTLYTRKREQGQRLKRYERRDAKRQFLLYYIQHPGTHYPCVSQSCKAIGVSRGTFYGWYKADAVFRKKIEAVNAVWFGSGDKDLQRYGKELIRRVSPQVLQETLQHVAFTEYLHKLQMQMYATINIDTSTFEAPPDDPGIQALLHDIPSVALEPDENLEAMLAESAAQFEELLDVATMRF